MRGGTLGSGAGADGTMDPEPVTDPGVLRVSPLDGAGKSACVGAVLFVAYISYEIYIDYA